MNNPETEYNMAWNNFFATGKIEYYLDSVKIKSGEPVNGDDRENQNKKPLRSIYEAEC